MDPALSFPVWAHQGGTTLTPKARVSIAPPPISKASLTPWISGCGSWGSWHLQRPSSRLPPPYGSQFPVALLSCSLPQEWCMLTLLFSLELHRKKGMAHGVSHGPVSRAARCNPHPPRSNTAAEHHSWQQWCEWLWKNRRTWQLSVLPGSAFLNPV